MTDGRCRSLWNQTIAIVRAVVLAGTGNEPPLKFFIPAAYLSETPSANNDPELTDEQVEEHRAKKQKLDAQIVHKAITEGKIRRR